MDPVLTPTATPVSQVQPTVQIAVHINMNIPPALRESMNPLQCETNRSFLHTVALFYFIKTRIPLWKLLHGRCNISKVLGAWVGAGDQRSDQCWRALANNFRFQSLCASESKKQPPRAIILFNSCHHGAISDVFTISWTQQRPVINSCAINFALLETRWSPNEELSPLDAD